MTELHRSTVDASGASVTAGYVPLADGAGLVTWGSVSIPAGTYVLTTEGGQETIKAHGATGATEAIDPTDGNIHTMTLDSNCTATIAAPTGSGGSVMEWWVTQDGTGGRVLTIAATGGTVTNTTTPDTTASGVVRYVLERLPATSNDWIVDLVGGGSSSPLTTKGDLWGYSTLDARVPVGTDGYVLTADSAAALGVSWAVGASHVYAPLTASDGAGGWVLVFTPTGDCIMV